MILDMKWQYSYRNKHLDSFMVCCIVWQGNFWKKLEREELFKSCLAMISVKCFSKQLKVWIISSWWYTSFETEFLVKLKSSEPFQELFIKQIYKVKIDNIKWEFPTLSRELNEKQICFIPKNNFICW